MPRGHALGSSGAESGCAGPITLVDDASLHHPRNDRVHPREPGQAAHRLMPNSEYREVLTEDRPDVDVALEKRFVVSRRNWRDLAPGRILVYPSCYWHRSSEAKLLRAVVAIFRSRNGDYRSEIDYRAQPPSARRARFQ